MAEEVKKEIAAEAVETPKEGADPKAEVKVVEPEKTPAQILNEGKSDNPRMVPEAVIIEMKKEFKEEKKEFSKKIKELEDKITAGKTDAVEVSDDLAALGEEFGVDKTFLAKLESALSKKVKALDEKVPVEDRETKINNAFEKHFNIAIEKLPDYAKIVNKDVIKTLSLQPQNANKTFSQLIEETYGNALSGKRTIDSTKPGGGKDPEPLDFARARKDSGYFDEVMADPTLKAEYNKRMLAEGF